MRFSTFKTPQPKRFNYRPRYYDEERAELEQKKAALGYDSKLSHSEGLRMQISKRWNRHDSEQKKSHLALGISYLFYGFVVFGGIYLIFFTDFVDKLVALFGVR